MGIDLNNMKVVCRRTCYVCSHGSHSASGKGLHYHVMPTRITARPVLDKWLAFLHLPPSESWPEELWRNICLCSLHFKEEDYRPGYQELIRPLLKDGAVPTQNPPTDLGAFSKIFFPALSENSYSMTTLMNDVEMQPIPMDTIEMEEYAEKYQEDLSCHLVLEDVRQELCRLCGQKESVLIPIFEILSADTTQEMPLSLKIEMYLPFKVKMDDPLPLQICLNCYNILNHWHELYLSCVAADAVLWKTFGKESKMSTKDVAHGRVEEDVQQDVNTTPETNAKVQEEPLVTLPSGEAKEEQGVYCTECGENKILSIPVEEDTFNKEFDKNFANFRSISYKCSFCYELFKGPCDRKNHMAMCRQLSTICELCGLKIPCRKDLRRHEYQKHARKNIRRRFLCDKCDKCFKTAAGLGYHIECVHEKNLSPQYHCELCCTAFVGKHHYRMHRKKHEKGLIKSVFQMGAFLLSGNSEDSQNDILYSCPVCQETFDDMLSLIVHLNAKKKVKCAVCLKVLSCEKHFMVHVCGQWTCQFCLKTFDKRVKWIVHERLHTGEKPIKCRTCDLTFRSYHNRRRHEEHHEPAYQCSYCGKSFRTKYVFRDHVLCHEGKVFSCHICDKKFSGRINLCKHINKFHKNITVPS